MFPSWIPKQITVRKDIQTAEDTQSFIETGTRAGCRRTPAGHAPRHAESPDPAPPCGAGYAKLLHEVAAVGKIPALRAFTHHLNDAPDAVILRSGTYLHFLKTFFRGVPLDDTPSLLHSAVWWSKFIVPGSPSPRRSGSASRGISTRSWRATRSATSPATASCVRWVCWVLGGGTKTALIADDDMSILR